MIAGIGAVRGTMASAGRSCRKSVKEIGMRVPALLRPGRESEPAAASLNSIL